jgi:hypothetical protein
MSSGNRWIVTILVLIIILVGIGWFLSSKSMLPWQNVGAKSSDWQAVFLTNGQVYFGKLSNADGKYANLKDIYYIQVAQQSEAQQKAGEQPQISLLKLGSELHGPADEMQINRDQILFIERLKNDSKVVDAINRYKKDGTGIANPTASPAAATSVAPVASPAQ